LAGPADRHHASVVASIIRLNAFKTHREKIRIFRLHKPFTNRRFTPTQKWLNNLLQPTDSLYKTSPEGHHRPEYPVGIPISHGNQWRHLFKQPSAAWRAHSSSKAA